MDEVYLVRLRGGPRGGQLTYTTNRNEPIKVLTKMKAKPVIVESEIEVGKNDTPFEVSAGTMKHVEVTPALEVDTYVPLTVFTTEPAYQIYQYDSSEAITNKSYDKYLALAAGIEDCLVSRLNLDPDDAAFLTTKFPAIIYQAILQDDLDKDWITSLIERAERIESRHEDPDTPQDEGSAHHFRINPS